MTAFFLSSPSITHVSLSLCTTTLSAFSLATASPRSLDSSSLSNTDTNRTSCLTHRSLSNPNQAPNHNRRSSSRSTIKKKHHRFYARSVVGFFFGVLWCTTSWQLRQRQRQQQRPRHPYNYFYGTHHHHHHCHHHRHLLLHQSQTHHDRYSLVVAHCNNTQPPAPRSTPPPRHRYHHHHHRHHISWADANLRDATSIDNRAPLVVVTHPLA